MNERELEELMKAMAGEREEKTETFAQQLRKEAKTETVGFKGMVDAKMIEEFCIIGEHLSAIKEMFEQNAEGIDPFNTTGYAMMQTAVFKTRFEEAFSLIGALAMINTHVNIDMMDEVCAELHTEPEKYAMDIMMNDLLKNLLN